MGTLRKEIKRQQEDGILQEENVYIAFWQDRTGWKSYSYRLAELEENEYAIYCNDLDRLIEIRETDSNAIVLHCGDFRFIHIDILKSYLVTDILRHYNSKKSPYKIDTIIKEFEREKSQEQAQPIKPKLDKQHFLQSVAGKTFINNAEIAYNTAKTRQPDREYWKICTVSALSILKYCYDVEYHYIVIKDNGFCIVTPDGTDVLYSYTEKE